MTDSSAISVSDKMLNHWQATVDVVAEIAHVPATLITYFNSEQIEIIASSQSSGNPYRVNELINQGIGFYCETVIRSKEALLIPNALKDSTWDNNPGIERGMISYFGLPICWPNGKPFGTICMLDSKDNNFSSRYQHLLTRFKESIEGDLSTLHLRHELTEANHSLEERVQNSTAELEQIKTILTDEINRRNDIENILKDNQFFFEESQRAAFIGSYRSDFITDTWETSEVCDQIFGINSNYHKCTQGWSGLVHPNDLEFMTTYMLEDVIGKNRAFNKEYRIIRRTDGETRWVHGLGETISDENGTCIGLIGTIQDITTRKEAELKLISEQSLLSTLIDTLPDLIWLKDTKGVFLRCNNRFESFFGAPRAKILGKTDYDFVSADLADLFRKYDRIAMDTEEPSVNEEEVPFAADGHHEFLETTKVPMRDNNGEIIGVLGIGHNITKRKEASEQLKLAANVFTHAHEGIVITDSKGNIVEVNETFSLITGYSRNEVLGKNPRIFQSGRQTPQFYESLWSELLENKHWSGELWNRRKNGEVFAEIITISAITDSNGKVQNYVALFTDITSIKEHQQQLERIAHYDVLTNLPNRTLLSDRIQQAILQSDRHKQSLAVAYLDLDNFKVINDTHGHKIGDELLISISQQMREALREGDTLARIGGDEFIALLVDTSEQAGYESVLNRLLQAAATPVIIEGIKLQTSASIGVTLYPQDNSSADILIRHADQAMYVAKQLGKSHYHLFDTNQDAAVKIQRESLKDIKQALERQEFVLYYQPKVNMITGQVIGVEALIRWLHPERGLVLPGDFLPITENHPISIDIGEWVIDTALKQVSEWKSAGLDIPVSVNVAAHQLQQKSFVDKLIQSLANHPNISPQHLELEILETSALEDITEVSTIMHTCHDIGVKFSIDDFGTGYSSLTYLRRLPAEVLKIDQSFVRDVLDDPDDRAIVQGVISLSAAFNRQVIAEGVETIPHGTQLIAMGCELAQGYGIARPMPATKIANWMTQWKPDPAWQA